MYDNVFVLCSGRSGSMTFAKACSWIKNYTSGHETTNAPCIDRFPYPTNHIEIDNHLAWMLGWLDEFHPNAFYVYLERNVDETVGSLLKRCGYRRHHSVLRAYHNGILQRTNIKRTDEMEVRIAWDMYLTIRKNIMMFLKDKKHMTFKLNRARTDFRKFWKLIGAKGNLHRAQEEWKRKYNTSAITNRYRRQQRRKIRTIRTQADI